MWHHRRPDDAKTDDDSLCIRQSRYEQAFCDHPKSGLREKCLEHKASSNRRYQGYDDCFELTKTKF